MAFILVPSPMDTLMSVDPHLWFYSIQSTGSIAAQSGSPEGSTNPCFILKVYRRCSRFLCGLFEVSCGPTDVWSMTCSRGDRTKLQIWYSIIHQNTTYPESPWQMISTYSTRALIQSCYLSTLLGNPQPKLRDQQTSYAEWLSFYFGLSMSSGDNLYGRLSCKAIHSYRYFSGRSHLVCMLA